MKSAPVQLGLFLIIEGVNMKKIISFIIYFDVNQAQLHHIHELAMNVKTFLQLGLYFIGKKHQNHEAPFYNY